MSTPVPPSVAATSSADIGVDSRGAARLVRLDRPRALNALTRAMRQTIGGVLTRAARDPDAYCVVLHSASERAFSAGSDVREVVATAKADAAAGRALFAEEYALNWHCECFSKPTVSLIDGMVMGGGVGVSLYGTHRVAGPGYSFAMPETAIGLFPDVGVCHVLARLPDAIGLYLGLTGHAIGRADAYALGLATHCIDSAAFADIIEGLAAAHPVDPLLDSRHRDPEAGPLMQRRGLIADCFSGETPRDILDRLAAVGGREADWAAGVRADLLKRSPTSLAITQRHIRAAAALDLRQTLITDYRIGSACLAGHDFPEGARAVLIDKDGAPRWRPGRIEDVTGEIVDAHFAVPEGGDLVLPTRAEMQALRA